MIALYRFLFGRLAGSRAGASVFSPLCGRAVGSGSFSRLDLGTQAQRHRKSDTNILLLFSSHRAAVSVARTGRDGIMGSKVSMREAASAW